MMPALSIIIPVYNVAPYLRVCLDSVLAQTFLDWEAICIDDGSTDSSVAILDEYAAQDARIKVIHQQNKGVSAARQIALENSSGTWIASVDPDDYVEPNYIENLFSAAESSGADMVWADYYEDTGNSSRRISQRGVALPNSFAEGLLTCALWGAMWNKLIRREFIVKAKARFPDVRLYAKEDLCFLAQVLAANPQMFYLDKCDYHYIIHAQSTIHRQNLYVFESDRYVQLCLEECFANFGLESLLVARRMHCKYDWYSLPTVSDQQFYETFSDIGSIWGLKVKFVHKIFYWVAANGFRSEIIKVFRFMRFIKSKLMDVWL